MQHLPYTRALLLALTISTAANCQTRVDFRTQSRNIDFSKAPTTKPIKTAPSLPETCSIGELLFKDNVEPGKNLFGCTAENQWTALGGGMLSSGCGLAGCESGECRVDSAVIPSYDTPLTLHGLVVSRESSIIGTVDPGPAGYVLVSSGTGADPAWAPLSGGAAQPAGQVNAVQYNAGTALAGVSVNDEAGRKFLMQAAGTAPGFEALQAADIPERVMVQYASLPAAKCQAGVAAANFNLPPANAPTAACQTGSTYGATLQFAANATQRFLEHFELPPDWSSSPDSVDLELAGRAADFTHAVNITVTYACAGQTAIDDLTFRPAASISFTPMASHVRTRTVLSNLAAEGCAANDEYYFEVAVTTDAAATAPYELISIRPAVRRLY
ncbi:MAG: hypothetical protein M1541_03305 [Acidobacteria bacterium]|nr:hypothetical protein [Acidobacteriota bacterium]